MSHDSNPGEACCRLPASITWPDLGPQARVFKALGDETRLRVLHLVRDQEVCVCDLMSLLQLAQGTLSHHLGVLQQVGLVTSRKQGRWNYYQATAAARRPLAMIEELE